MEPSSGIEPRTRSQSSRNGEIKATITTNASKWYRRAAEQGHVSSQYNLALNIFYGQGILQDYTEAVRWYRKAAEQGFAEAQYNLGFMYEKGMGVPQDYVQAHKWFNLAASRLQGKKRNVSVQNRNVVEKRITPAQVAEAQKLAREWKPKTWKELSQQN
jgi:hypothetical protein